MALITIIGRGHSGTRMLSHTLYASGGFMGNRLNTSGDKVPPDDLYEACRVMARHVRHAGGLQWDTAALHEMEIDPEFVCLVESYLRDVLDAKDEHKGWKLPETTLIYPWIVRMFPDIKYIHWVRDPRDSILGGHRTDDLSDFGSDYQRPDDVRRRRASSSTTRRCSNRPVACWVNHGSGGWPLNLPASGHTCTSLPPTLSRVRNASQLFRSCEVTCLKRRFVSSPTCSRTIVRC